MKKFIEDARWAEVKRVLDADAAPPTRKVAPGEVVPSARSHNLGEPPATTLLSDFARGMSKIPGRGKLDATNRDRKRR